MADILPIQSLNRFAWTLGIPKHVLCDLARTVDLYYNPFPKPKKNGDVRMIDNPLDPLKGAQRAINERILRYVELPENIIGGVKGRKPSSHAEAHIHQPVVLTLDVKSCYPSITNAMVFKLWRHSLGCSRDVSSVATKLTTWKGHLPHGAPTSNALANLVLCPCIERVTWLASERGYAVTQYVDDMALSGPPIQSDLITMIVREFSRIGLRIGRGKTAVMGAGETQIVTNLRVNRRVTVPTSRRIAVRAAVHELERLNPRNPNYAKSIRSVRGRIYNMKPLHPDQAARLLDRLDQLPAAA